jgi:hypothetical protein
VGVGPNYALSLEQELLVIANVGVPLGRIPLDSAKTITRGCEDFLVHLAVCDSFAQELGTAQCFRASFDGF